MNLLIADDEAVIRRGLLSLDWKSIGITDVYLVANGVEAKELLLSTSIDLVIFDIRMPGFSGLELAQMVKERSMDVAVVLLSGFSEFEYARSAMRYGVYEYLLYGDAFLSLLLSSVFSTNPKHNSIPKNTKPPIIPALKSLFIIFSPFSLYG